jgi:hypothetical protein
MKSGRWEGKKKGILSKYGQYASSVGMGAKEDVVLQNCMESLQISQSNNTDQHWDCDQNQGIEILF